MAIHGYVRVSTRVQAREEKTSLEDQERSCRTVAAHHGENNPTIWIDAGVSGAVHLSDRPQGKLMLEALQTGDILIATRLDRVFRSSLDALQMAEAFRDQEIGLILMDVSGTQPIMSSPSAKLFFDVLAAVSNFEMGRRRERTAEGRASVIARGGSANRPPYGWKTVDGLRVVDEHEMHMLRMMRRLHAAGKNNAEISHILWTRKYGNRKGKRLDPRQVAVLLERPEHPAELELEMKRRHPNGKPVEIAMPYSEAPLVLPAPPPPPKSREETIRDKLRASVKGVRLLEAIVDASDLPACRRAQEVAAERYGWARVNKLLALAAQLQQQGDKHGYSQADPEPGYRHG